MVTDDEIKQRLTALTGFTPCDKWNHIVSSLRKGKAYFVRRLKDGKREIKLLDNPVEI